MTAAPVRRSDLPIYVVALLAAYLCSAGITTVYAMLAMLNRSFDDPLRVGWVITGYYLVSAICAALCGRLGDLLGRRLLFLVSLVLCFVGSMISATASDLNAVVIGCAIQGGSGALLPLTIGIIRENLRREAIPMAISTLWAAATVTAGISFFLAGYVIDHFSWNGGFYMKAVLSVVAFITVWKLLPRPAHKIGSLRGVNLWTGVLFAPAVAGIFIAVEMAQHIGWTHPGVLAVTGLSLLLLAYWARNQLGQAKPLIAVRSLANRPIALANLGMLLVSITSMQNTVMLSLLLQQPTWTQVGFGLNATLTGLTALPLNGVALFAAPWGGRIISRHGGRRAALYGASILSATWLIMTLFHHSLWFFLTVNFFCMFGLAATNMAIYNIVVEATPHENTSEATGLTYVFLAVFMAIGAQIVFGLLTTSRISDPAFGATTYPSDGAYTLVFGYFAAISLLLMLVTWALPRRRKAAAGQPPGFTVRANGAEATAQNS